MADNTGGNTGGAVKAGFAHGGDVVDELCLTDRLQGRRPLVPVHAAALDEYRKDDVVTAIGVGQQIVEQIARLGLAGAKIP